MACQPLQSTSTNHSQRKVTTNNLPQLLNLLQPVAHKCVFIGLQLGVSDHMIRNIRPPYPDNQTWLYEILRHRLKQTPSLTWHDIVSALRSNSVQEHRIASGIEFQYIHQSSLSKKAHYESRRAQSYGLGSHVPHAKGKCKSMVQSCSTGSSNRSSGARRRQYKSPVAQSQGTGFVRAPPRAMRSRYKSPVAQLHGTGPGSDPPQEKKVECELPMAQYIEYVKKMYQQCAVEKKLNAIKWPPTPSTVYINLVCVDCMIHVSKEEADECSRAMICDGSMDVILKKKTPIIFSNIAKDVPLSGKKLILVEGAPGVGKSTLAWEFCRRWERGEIAQQYQLVLLLRLRDKEMSKAQTLSDLLHHPSKVVVQAVEDELIATLGVNTLIILEGFDELPSTCRTQSSVFFRLINGELPHATVLVTSRPWATRDIHWECRQRIFQHIEILGFTGKQIEEYVTSVFTDRGKPASDKTKKNIEEVMSYIKTYPQIKACMYIPLNSAIVVCVYQESKAGKCILPKTLTQLYYALTQTLLLRYLYGHPEYGQRRWKIQSLKEDLPPDMYSKLLAVSELAYSGICTDHGDSVQLIFSNLPPDFETLGLMQSVPQMYVTQGEDMSHNFLHLTVQEFLAALHISNRPPEKQLEHFQEGRGWKEGRWRVVLRFLAGITKLANLSPEDLRGLLQKERHEGIKYSRTANVILAIQHVNWIFETQRDDSILVLQKKTVEFRGDWGLTLLDYYTLGYIIVHSHCKWELTMDSNMGKEEVRMLVNGANTKHDTSARVVRLRGGSRDEDEGHGYDPLSISTEALNLLFTSLKNMIHLQELHLDLPVECSRIEWPDLSGLQVLHLGISDERNWRLDTLLSHLSLESLKIEVARSLSLDNIAFIGEILLHSTCSKHVDITDKHSPITAKVAKDRYVHVHDKHLKNRAPSAHEDQPNKDIMCRLDCYSLGYIIVHSHFHWELTVYYKTEREKMDIGEQEVRMLVEGANTRHDTSARVVSLASGRWGHSPLSISAGILNTLFTGLQRTLDLQKLCLYLPEECSGIKWPDLSGLRVLHLGINDERNWRLDTLLPHLSLESLTIKVARGLSLDNIAFIKKLIVSSTCPKHVDITDEHSPIIARVAVGHHQNLENRAPAAREDKPNKVITCRLKCYSLGYIIVHSCLHWELRVNHNIRRKEVRMLAVGANTRCDTSARVVGFRILSLSISAGVLNALFTGLQHILDLQELHLDLPEESSKIKWPDLSGLRVLYIKISGDRNWRLDTLLPLVSLESLTIEVARGLSPEIFASIEGLLLSSTCPKHVNITDNHSPITAKVVKDQHVHDKLLENGAPSAHEDQPNKDITCRLDCYSLGYIIVHSHFNWELIVDYELDEWGDLSHIPIREEEVRMLVDGANTRCDTRARVGGLRGRCHGRHHGNYGPLSISAEALNVLFTGLQGILHLQELHLDLLEECSSITWPDLSGLQILHLGISCERNWRLDTLLPHLSLESLAIEIITYTEGYLVLEDCVAIGMLLSSSNCLKCLNFQSSQGCLLIDTPGMESITKALSDNKSLPLRYFGVEFQCTFSDTAAHHFALFITNSTTLHHLRLGWCTLSAHGLLELAQAIHHSSSLQERELEGLTCTVDGDDEATDCAQLSDPNMISKFRVSHVTIEELKPLLLLSDVTLPCGGLTCLITVSVMLGQPH